DQVEGRVETAGADDLVEVVEPMADLGGEVPEKGTHAGAAFFVQGTVRCGVAARSGRRCGATAAAEAASRLVVREKSRWAARRESRSITKSWACLADRSSGWRYSPGAWLVRWASATWAIGEAGSLVTAT